MRNNRRMFRSKEGSDESDEDYMVGEEEEFDESEDEHCSASDADEAEEFLDQLEEDDEEEFVEKKVRKVGRPKGKKTGHASWRKKNGFVKPRRKRALYSEDEEEKDDDDDDDDADFNFSDEKTNKAAKPRKKKRISESEEEDDSNCADYDFDDENNEAVNQRKKKRVSYREEDDDGADSDFNDEKVNIPVRRRVKKKASYKEEDEEDDDYDVANDMFDNEKVNIVARSRVKKKASYKEEDDDYDVENDIYDDEMVSQAAKPRKKKEVSYREEEDDDYDGNDDDDDDEEFTPDEIDGVEDEDDLLVAEKNKKVGRPQLQEKVVTRGWKRKRNSKVLKKTVTKRPRNNCRRRRTIKNENNGELIGSEPIVEEKIKKVNGRRKRRSSTVISDSDFASSGSSDFEYTISEEEREQVQEANRFCRGLTTSLRSSTSSKKLEEEKEMLIQQKRLTRKGKEKVEEMKVEAGKQVCGICLTKEGKRTVRGTLNCCSHYFCFACIMEWSKVESRCPLCKQRFVTISKPARLDTGFDLRTVVIPIPERDQVYQPSEEELQGFLDPYDNVICTECHHGGDDALMLLCDLCDSSAHTYCVGLGREVPEGDWYCEGCRPAALGSSNPQVLTPTPDFRTNSNLSVRSSPVSGIRETFDLNEIYVPDTPLTHEISQLQSPRLSVRDVQLPSPASGSGAFTVLERRRIQHQIHQLLNNRRRQMDDRVPQTPTTVSGHSLFGSQVGRSRELATQHVPTQERMSSSNIYFHGSLQDTTMPLFQNLDLPSARLAHMGGQLNQSQPSTSTNRSFSGYMQEFDGLNTSIGLRLGHQQPCSGSSNMGSDSSRSSYPFREDDSYCHEVPDARLGFTLVTHPNRQ